MNPLDDMMFEFEDAVNEHVRRMWNITKEISEKGELYDRAVGKEIPMEIIHTDMHTFQLNLN